MDEACLIIEVIPEFIEEAVRCLAYNLVIKDDLEIGFWVWALIELEVDGLV